MSRYLHPSLHGQPKPGVTSPARLLPACSLPEIPGLAAAGGFSAPPAVVVGFPGQKESESLLSLSLGCELQPTVALAGLIMIGFLLTADRDRDRDSNGSSGRLRVRPGSTVTAAPFCCDSALTASSCQHSSSESESPRARLITSKEFKFLIQHRVSSTSVHHGMSLSHPGDRAHPQAPGPPGSGSGSPSVRARSARRRGPSRVRAAARGRAPAGPFPFRTR